MCSCYILFVKNGWKYLKQQINSETLALLKMVYDFFMLWRNQVFLCGTCGSRKGKMCKMIWEVSSQTKDNRWKCGQSLNIWYSFGLLRGQKISKGEWGWITKGKYVCDLYQIPERFNDGKNLVIKFFFNFYVHRTNPKWVFHYFLKFLI